MNGVMLLGQRFADLHKLCADQFQTAPFQAGNYFADQSTLNSIGFYQYQRMFHFSLHRKIIIYRAGFYHNKRARRL